MSLCNLDQRASQWIRMGLPYFSRKFSAFSRKEGPPSISSKASRIGLPTTKDLTGRLSFPERKVNCLKNNENGTDQCSSAH